MCNRNETRGAEAYPMNAIGVIHTPFVRQEGTPIQAAVANGTAGEIELFAGYSEGLLDLEGFERLWLIYVLDRVSGVQLRTTPYLDTEQHGVFATRSPARPNRIGLSAVRLTGIEHNRLLVADVDMLDGTPLLDIKPYVPAFDVFPVSRIGWYAGKSIAGAVADSRFKAD